MSAPFGDAQRELPQLWNRSRKGGCMSPWQHARAYGLKEAWEELRGGRVHGKMQRVADRVYVQGPGRHHSHASSISKLVCQMDADEGWFPVNVYGGLGGRLPARSETNKAAIASSAMAMKGRGVEPTHGLVIAQCPTASINPAAGCPVGNQIVCDILESRCYDLDPDAPWSHQKRLAKVAALPRGVPKGASFGKHAVSLDLAPYLHFRHVVWTDICNIVLRATFRAANAQALAQEGGAGRMSSDAKHEAASTRGSNKDLVLAGKEGARVYWAPVLARGKLHLEWLGFGFAGDHVSGAPDSVRQLRSSINARFRADQRGIAFVDLGGGFCLGGNIAHGFKLALREHVLTAFHSDGASVQPGHPGDLWPRETAVAWVTERLRLTLPTEPWAETEEDFEGRLMAAATRVNAQHDVAGLCRQMPQRMRDLVHVVKGGRLDK